MGRTSSGSRIAARGTKWTPSANAAGEVGGDLEGQAGLADAAGTGQGHEAHIVPSQKIADGRRLPLAADEGREWRGRFD